MNTTKHFLKVLFCKAGYAKNLKVERYYGEGWSVCYKISGENKDGDVLMLEGTGSEIVDDYLERFKEEGNLDPDWIGSELKYMANDEIRNSIVKSNEERDAEILATIKRLAPSTEWANDNNPCPDCNNSNKRPINDMIHYNCEYCANGASGNCEEIDIYRTKHQIYINFLSNRDLYMYCDKDIVKTHKDVCEKFITDLKRKHGNS